MCTTQAHKTQALLASKVVEVPDILSCLADALLWKVRFLHLKYGRPQVIYFVLVDTCLVVEPLTAFDESKLTLVILLSTPTSPKESFINISKKNGLKTCFCTFPMSYHYNVIPLNTISKIPLL